MQHDVIETVLQAFSRQKVGRSSPTVAGLWVTPLIGLPALTPQTKPPAASELRWAEAYPPHPGWLRATNASHAAVSVRAGAVLAGGMSARAVRAATTVAPDSWADVSVEPLGARWWDEGILRWHGLLSPVAAALLLHAVLAEGAIASSARTAIWSLSLGDLATPWDVWRPDEATAGWVLSDAAGALAAQVTEPGGARVRATSTPNDAYPASRVVASLVSRVNSGMLVGHVLEGGDDGDELAVLPAGLELVDHVAGAMNMDRPM